MKIFLPIILLAAFAAPICVPGLSAQNVDTRYTAIKDLILQRRLDAANTEVERMLKENPNDPSLMLYQTEVWIELGMEHDRAGNQKTALDYYTRAYQYWPSHPVLRKRFLALQGRQGLYDRTAGIPEGQAAAGRSTVYIAHPALDAAANLWAAEIKDLFERSRDQNEKLEGIAAEIETAKSQSEYLSIRINIIIGVTLFMALLQLIFLIGRRKL